MPSIPVQLWRCPKGIGPETKGSFGVPLSGALQLGSYATRPSTFGTQLKKKGQDEIRTRDSVCYNCFQNNRLKPLSHRPFFTLTFS
jgi:hypothetical protein